MRRIKKGLAILLAALLLGPVLPAFAAERESRTVSDGDAQLRTESPSVSGNQAAAAEDNLSVPYGGADIASGVSGGITWVIDGSGKLTLTGSGDFKFGVIPWTDNSNSIKSAEIRVTGMTNASFMFWNCHNLERVDLSYFDTSSILDVHEMFDGCGMLTEINFGSSFKCQGSMYAMFRDCGSLKSIDLSSFDTQKVTDMGAMFFGCNSLTNLDLSSFDTSNVTNMQYMFGKCTNLDVLDLSNFNTANVINMSGMFCDCSQLESLNLGSFKTDKVENMDMMFSNDANLTTLDLDSFNTISVVSMNGMFSGCKKIERLKLDNFDTSNVVEMRFIFQNCNKIKVLDLSNINTSNVQKMDGMFSGCSSLISLDLRKFDTGKVTNMGQMFQNCSNIVDIEISSFDTRNVTFMGDMFSGCSSLISLDMSNFDAGGVTIEMLGRMLENCNKLVKIYTPRNFMQSVALPTQSGTKWTLPDGTEVTELPQNRSDSVLLTRQGIAGNPDITTTTPDLNMTDVIRVKYVPYSYTVETNNVDPANAVTFSIVEGKLAEGLQIYPATGEIYGMPMEAGEFRVKVRADYSNPAYLPSYAELTLIVLDNTDDNVGIATDAGYDITQPVEGFNRNIMPGEGSQTLVSQGEFAEFLDVYLDGEKLNSGTEYTAEAGSTRITILNQTLARGGVGTHTLSVEFRTQDADRVLKRAAQNYRITDSDGNTTEGDNQGGNANNSGSNGTGNNNVWNMTGTGAGGALNDKPEEALRDKIIIYSVLPGDNLWKIAVKFYGSGNYWMKIYNDNRAMIKNPGRIYTGQQLLIHLMEEKETETEEIEGEVYIIRSGDSLWKVAQRIYGDGKLWRKIYQANRDTVLNPGRLRAGQKLLIPEK